MDNHSYFNHIGDDFAGMKLECQCGKRFRVSELELLSVRFANKNSILSKEWEEHLKQVEAMNSPDRPWSPAQKSIFSK